MSERITAEAPSHQLWCEWQRELKSHHQTSAHIDIRFFDGRSVLYRLPSENIIRAMVNGVDSCLHLVLCRDYQTEIEAPYDPGLTARLGPMLPRGFRM
jgi:hypothetical protein